MRLTQLHHVRGCEVTVAEAESLAVWFLPQLLYKLLHTTPTHHRAHLHVLGACSTCGTLTGAHEHVNFTQMELNHLELILTHRMH